MKTKLVGSLLLVSCLVACGSDDQKPRNPAGAAGSGSIDIGSGSGGPPPIGTDGSPGGTGEVIIPKTCAEAANARTYVGCEFWPTVTANPVWVEFDPVVVVAN